MRRLLWFVVIASASLTAIPSSAQAQASITGVAKDTSGAVLPGVTVEATSPALIEKVRTVTTDGTCQYRSWICARASTPCRSPCPGSCRQARGDRADRIVFRHGECGTPGRRRSETVTVSGASPVVDISNASSSA